MSSVTDRIAGALAAEVGSRTGWDEPPAHYPGPDGRPAIGTVPEALERIVSSILGVGL